MGITGRLAWATVATALVTAGAASVVVPWADASAASHAAVVPAAAAPLQPGSCVLDAPALPATAAPIRRPATTAGPRSAGSGGLVVAIPPAVFIRKVGPLLVVTTNTGRAPQPWDTFYYVANGHAGVAGGTLRREVRSRCATLAASAANG